MFFYGILFDKGFIIKSGYQEIELLRINFFKGFSGFYRWFFNFDKLNVDKDFVDNLESMEFGVNC